MTFTFTFTYVLRSSFIFLLKLYLARQRSQASQFCVLSTFSDSQSRQHLCVLCITRALDSHGSQQKWSLLRCDSRPDQNQSAPADLTKKTPFDPPPPQTNPNINTPRLPSPPLQSHAAATWCLQYSLPSTRKITPSTQVPHAVQSPTRACHTCSFPMSTSNNAACHNSR